MGLSVGSLYTVDCRVDDTIARSMLGMALLFLSYPEQEPFYTDSNTYFLALEEKPGWWHGKNYSIFGYKFLFGERKVFISAAWASYLKPVESVLVV